MDRLPIDALQNCIFNRLDFLMQIRLRQVCKWFYRLEIHDMYNIDSKYCRKLTDNILINHPSVRYLDASNNPKITDVNHMTKLQKLEADGNYGINNDGIKRVNLIELDAYDNPKITDINHMTKLQKLNAGWDCGINDDGIKHVNLIELEAFGNPKITRKI